MRGGAAGEIAPASIPAALPRRRGTAAIVFLCVLAGAGSAAAQDNKAPGSDDPLSRFLKGVKLKTDVGDMPDFVVESRPPADTLHYIPIGGARPEPATPTMSVEKIKAEESELDALRLRHDRIAGRKSDPVPHTSVADGRKPPPPKPKPPKCILTCDILHIPKPGAN
jgi:hypothetical protein